MSIPVLLHSYTVRYVHFGSITCDIVGRRVAGHTCALRDTAIWLCSSSSSVSSHLTTYLCFIDAAKPSRPRFSQLANRAATSSLSSSWHWVGSSLVVADPLLLLDPAPAVAAVAAELWRVGRREQLITPARASDKKDFCCCRKLRTSPSATCRTAMESCRREAISRCSCCNWL